MQEFNPFSTTKCSTTATQKLAHPSATCHLIKSNPHVLTFQVLVNSSSSEIVEDPIDRKYSEDEEEEEDKRYEEYGPDDPVFQIERLTRSQVKAFRRTGKVPTDRRKEECEAEMCRYCK